MSAGGDASLAVARSRVGMTEQPPQSNMGPWWDWWGCGTLGSWCAAFTSWCSHDAGYPLPVINPSCSDATGYVSCDYATEYAWLNGQVPSSPEPGDILIFSWEPWELQGGVPIITSGQWTGWVAGDHTGYWVADLGGGYIQTIEGNTGSSSWDNGGAVLERTDRYWGQICALWRPPVFGGGGTGVTPPPTPTPTPPPSGGGGGTAPPWPGTYLADFTAGGGAGQWQAQMAARGWHIDVDDQYGPASAEVCRQFQAEKGLEVDGVVGPITWDAAWTAPIT
jgi:hypothetical protein